MKNCSQCGEPVEAEDKFCPKCGKPQTPAAEPKPKVIFELPPTIGFLKNALAEREIDLALRPGNRDNRALVLLFLSVDKAIDEPARQVLQTLGINTKPSEFDLYVGSGSSFGAIFSIGRDRNSPFQILASIKPEDEDDRYEIIVDEFYLDSHNSSWLLAVLAVLAAFDGVYSENEKKLIRRFVRLWNVEFAQKKIEQSTLEAVETAIRRLCENENKRQEIRISPKNYQQVKLELSAIKNTDQEIVNGLFDLLGIKGDH